MNHATMERPRFLRQSDVSSAEESPGFGPYKLGDIATDNMTERDATQPINKLIPLEIAIAAGGAVATAFFILTSTAR